MVCAPSNNAVDNLESKLISAGLNVTRMVFFSAYHNLPKGIQNITFYNKVLDDPDGTNEIKHYLKLKLSKPHLLKTKRHIKLKRVLSSVKYRILMSSDVDCSTCSMSKSTTTKKLKFKSVLIDKSTQSIESECFLPMLSNSNQVILVGDHKQLGPVVLSNKAQPHLSISLFHRLVTLSVQTDQLLIQYRMHPNIVKISNHMFYDGRLINGVTERKRQDFSKFPLPINGIPSLFMTTKSHEEHKKLLFYNPEKVIVCKDIDEKLTQGGVKLSQIDIVTLYAAQREMVQSNAFHLPAVNHHPTLKIPVVATGLMKLRLNL